MKSNQQKLTKSVPVKVSPASKKHGAPSLSSSSSSTKVPAQSMNPGATSAPRDEVVALSKISGKSTFANALTDLKKLKLILVISNGSQIELTDEGSELANTHEISYMTNEEHHEMVKKQWELKDKELSVFELLQDGEIHTREDIFKASGCKAKNSTFANLLTKLKKAKILESVGNGDFKMPDKMFPFKN
jgi:hypothetical protein